MFVVSSGFARDYSIKRLLNPKEQFRSLFLHWNSAYSLFVFALFMTHATDFYSRGSILVQYGAGLAVVLIMRLLLGAAVARGLEAGTLEGKNVAVVGAAGMVNDAIRRLPQRRTGREDRQRHRPDRRLRHADRKAAPTTAKPSPTRGNRRRRRGHPAHGAAPTARRHRHQLSLVRDRPNSGAGRGPLDHPRDDPPRAQQHLADDARSAPGPDWADADHSAGAGATDACGTVSSSERSISSAHRSCCVAALPLFALIALLIKLDSPGPVLFRQRRHGFNHREFRVIKFRTMSTLDDGIADPAGAPQRRSRHPDRAVPAQHEPRRDPAAHQRAGRPDVAGRAAPARPRPRQRIRGANPRNTRGGTRSSRGSPAGRRSTAIAARPARSTRCCKRVDHDLYYIDHWSLMLDIRILLMTLLSPRSYRNAY